METVIGCRAVDHFATRAEVRALELRPYSICPLDQAKKMPFINTPNNKTIFHFENLDELPLSLELSVPKPWGDHENKMCINLHEEHATLRESIATSNRSAGYSADPYETERDARGGFATASTPSFIPFALFMRVSSDLSPTRAVAYREIGLRSCRRD